MSEHVSSAIDRLLSGLGVDSREGLDDRLYGELHLLARRFMRNERRDHTLQPTALVHEAWLRAVAAGARPPRAEQSGEPGGRAAHEAFLAAAAVAMRRVLVDHARRTGTEKRGGGWERISVSELPPEGAPRAGSGLDVLALDAALESLARLDPRLAKVVELRFFSGMSGAAIGRCLGVSRNTVVRDLKLARAWLQRELRA